MNSAKNTVVAILLLGVSYGVYQVINAPDTGDPLAGLMKMVEPSGKPPVDSGTEAGTTGSADDWNASYTAPAPAIPPELPPLQSQSMGQVPVQNAPATPEQTPALQTPGLSQIQPPGIGGFSSVTGPSTRPLVEKTISPPSSATINMAPVKPKSEGFNSRFGAPAAVSPTAQTTIQPAPANSYTGTPATLATLSAEWPAVEQMVNEGKFRDALAKLTPYQERTGATSPDRAQLTAWLDALAAKVIYSTEHQLDSTPYIVRQGETLDSLATSWGVPAQLIYNINRQRIPNPSALTPGIELKKIAGPFRAVVSTTNREMTLYVDDLYAGRFALATEASGVPGGSWHVIRKQSSGNPCGDFCLELDQPGLALHAAGSNLPSSGTLSFQTADAEDLFGILSEGSEVTIR